MTGKICEVFGPPGIGKTHQSHQNSPGPYHLDTAYTQTGFRELDIVESESGVGESWPVIVELYESDATAKEHYEYVDTWPEDITIPGATTTVIVDNLTALRTMAAAKWADNHDADWPAQSQWGSVNNMVRALVQGLKAQGHIVVCITQLTDEYINDSKTGNKVPKSGIDMDYMADWRIELTQDGEGARVANIVKNRFVDQFGSGWVEEMPTHEFDLELLMDLSGVEA